jgi:Peptidase M66
LVLVSNRAVLVKVNAITTNSTQAKPAGSLRVETSTGALVQTIALTPPTSALATTVPVVPSLASSYTAVVPASLVKTGLRLTASLVNGQTATTINPRVGGGVAMTFVAVPIQIEGTVGQVIAGLQPFLQARLPVASVTLQTHAAYPSKTVTTLPIGDVDWGPTLSKVLGEIDDLRTLEQASALTYYYGFVPQRTLGTVGVGMTPGQAAVGLDFPAMPEIVRETLIHELGHNLSLLHAPCGVAAGNSLDPLYPYAEGQLGAPGRYIWGYDASTQTFIDPHRTDIRDAMSYCTGDTFSDYNYRKLQVYLTPTDAFVVSASAAVATGPQELLLVSGEIESGKVALRPLKAFFGEATSLPQNGPYTLRVVADTGTIEYRFALKQMDHVATATRFSFAIPHPGAISSLSIVKDGATLIQNVAQAASRVQALTASSVKPQVQATEQGGVLRLSWDNAKYPYLTVTHVGTKQRMTLAQDLEGGSAALPITALSAGGSFEFSLSDGMNSVRVTRAR